MKQQSNISLTKALGIVLAFSHSPISFSASDAPNLNVQAAIAISAALDKEMSSDDFHTVLKENHRARNWGALHVKRACTSPNPDPLRVRLLLREGFGTPKNDKRLQQALAHVCVNPRYYGKDLPSDNIKILTLLLGAGVGQQEYQEYETFPNKLPIEGIISGGIGPNRLDAARLLIAFGTDVNGKYLVSTDMEGQPFFERLLTMIIPWGCDEWTGFLLNQGADPVLENSKGETAVGPSWFVDDRGGLVNRHHDKIEKLYCNASNHRQDLAKIVTSYLAYPDQDTRAQVAKACKKPATTT